MHTIFLSHSSEDNELAKRLKERLEAAGHRHIFLDFDLHAGIRPGEEWERTLHEKLRQCKALIALYSPHYGRSEWCYAELGIARFLGKKIFPVYHGEGTPESSLLGKSQFVDLSREGGFELLCNELRQHVGTWDPGTPPYPGLRAFTEKEAAVFRGRDALVKEGVELVANLATGRAGVRFLLITGAAVTGKSSLLQAGMLPRLRAEEDRWVVLDCARPADRPLAALAQSLHGGARRSGLEWSRQELLDQLERAVADPDHSGAGWLRERLRELHARRSRTGSGMFTFNPVTILPIDALEELLPGTSGGGVVPETAGAITEAGPAPADPQLAATRRGLLQLLGAALTDPATTLLVVATCRREHLPALRAAGGLGAMTHEELEVAPPMPDELRRCIEEPAAIAGIELEPGLAQKLQHDLTDGDTSPAVALPLLAFTLHELHRERQDPGAITLHDYDSRLGGITQAIARSVRRAAARLPASARQSAALKRLLLEMVSQSDDGRPARRTLPAARVAAEALPLLDELVQSGLVVPVAHGGRRDAGFQLAHLALCGAWSQLAGWLAAERASLSLRSELEDAVRRWQAAGRSRDLLWRGERLRAARHLTEPGGWWPAPELAEFLQAGTDDEEEHRETMAMLDRLADDRRLQDLRARAERLWPPYPAQLPAMRAWLAEAARLHERLPQHLQTLAELRQRGQRHEVERPPAEREQHPQWAELVACQERYELLSRAAADDPTLAVQVAIEQRELASAIHALRRGVERMEAWRFDSPEEQWMHDTLAGLVAQLQASLQDGGRGETMLSGMQQRAALAERMEELTVSGEEAARRWGECRAGVAASPVYGGLALAPQMGLLPLWRHPASGLWEFLVVQSGAAPARPGEVKEDTGIVLVLVPGGAFWMGAQDEPGRNFDPHALPFEAPVREVALEPYFLAKEPMTQGQWLRITGSNPSRYGPGTRAAGHQHDLTHPVEQVSWQDCVTVLSRMGLELPTEAQWEYACRAGTDTPWYCGADAFSLRGEANLRDQAAAVWEENLAGHGAGPSGLDDGFAHHSPVGHFGANSWGFHDMIGNIWEWCRDRFATYDTPPRPGDGERDAPLSRFRVGRGGSYLSQPIHARSASRNYETPEYRKHTVGCRPARGRT